MYQEINVLTRFTPVGIIIANQSKEEYRMHHDHDHVGGCGHCHGHEHHHDHCHGHEHGHCNDHGQGCCGNCHHSPMEELVALMKYMVGHNAAHAKELADLAAKLEQAGNHMAFEQVMAAVSDFEKGNMRLSLVLTALDVK